MRQKLQTLQICTESFSKKFIISIRHNYKMLTGSNLPQKCAGFCQIKTRTGLPVMEIYSGWSANFWTSLLKSEIGPGITKENSISRKWGYRFIRKMHLFLLFLQNLHQGRGRMGCQAEIFKSRPELEILPAGNVGGMPPAALHGTSCGICKVPSPARGKSALPARPLQW